MVVSLEQMEPEEDERAGDRQSEYDDEDQVLHVRLPTLITCDCPPHLRMTKSKRCAVRAERLVGCKDGQFGRSPGSDRRGAGRVVQSALLEDQRAPDGATSARGFGL